MSDAPRWPAALALGASLAGLAFAVSSSLDYAAHLDRELHPLHCGLVLGLGADEGVTSACGAAMYGPYGALFRNRFWGGVPIALYGVGVFSFFAGFSLYLLLAGRRAAPRAPAFFAFEGSFPLAFSLVMAVISAVQFGDFCKTCLGIYAAAALLAVGAHAHKAGVRRAAEDEMRRPRRPELPRADAWWHRVGWNAAGGAASVIPAIFYLGAMPDYAGSLERCGALSHPLGHEERAATLHFTTSRSHETALIVVDPMCPSCKALDRRLKFEGYLDQLDASVVLFPLDTECNSRIGGHQVNPGSCLVSKAILCSDHRARAVLDWAYAHQEQLSADARDAAGPNNVRAAIRRAWPALDVCMDSKATAARLERMMQLVVAHDLPLSTPQLFVGDKKVCDEDADLGLAYTLERLAPSLGAK